MPLPASVASLRACGISLSFDDGRAVLSHRGGLQRSLQRAGQPVDTLLPGWAVADITAEFAPVLIVFLIHDSGNTGRWIIDELSETFNEPVSQLPTSIRDTLRAGMLRLLQDVRRRGMDALTAWNAIPRVTRLELMADTVHHTEDGRDSLIDIMGAGDRNPSGVLEVHSEDNLLSVLLNDRVEVPILSKGSVLQNSDFLEGWAAELVYCDFAPFFLLELRHETGRRATWILDQHLSFICDIHNLTPAVKDQLCLRAAPVIERHLASVLAFADPASDPMVERYLQLNDEVRQVLVTHCAGTIRPPPTSLGLRQMPAVLPVTLSVGERPCRFLPYSAVKHAVTTDLHQQTIEALLTGHLEWPSPLDGSLTVLTGIFMWDEYTFFYHFVDRNGLSFIVVASDRVARLIGLLIPSINLMLFDDSSAGSHDPNIWMFNSLGGQVWWILVRHVNQFAQEMALRRRTEHARPVNVLLTSSRLHIGHHLWNDLSGFEALCNALPPDHLPTTVIIGAPDGSAEFFGPIEALFPEMRGHIDRSFENVDAFIRWVYEHDVWPARITREYVSISLRARVMNHLAMSDEAAQVQSMPLTQSDRRHRAPIVMFGLRVEDRTLVHLHAFCESFVSFMVEHHPDSTIVFDGYNRRPGAMSKSVNPGMVHHLSSKPPEDVEIALVNSLIEQSVGKPVTIIGTTGQSVATSLAWCQRADAAFAIWGAGLSKIRWLANLPTMIVTGRTNMLHRSDIAIYHDPTFMEASAPVLFPDPSLVEDAPDHIALAYGFIQDGRECFTVKVAEVIDLFGEFLNQTLRDKNHI